MKLNVTEVRIIPYQFGAKGLLGFVSCTIDDAFKVSGIALYAKSGGEGFRLVFPHLPGGNEENKQYAFRPVSKSAYERLEQAVSDRARQIFRCH